MSVYLHDIPLSQALDQLWQLVAGMPFPAAETVPLAEGIIGRTLAAPIWAKISAPHYHASAMDGFAVRAHETNGATQTAPLTLRYGDQTQYVDTGDPLPDWANAVIQIENTEPINANGTLSDALREPYAIRIREATNPWKHVRPMGEDMVATQLVLPAGHVLRPFDLGAIAGSGHHEVSVARRPRVAILPTGSELKPIGVPVYAGDIIEYNSLVLAAQVREWGGEPTRFPITPDRFEAIQATVREAAKDHDLILLNAGSSAGAEDFSASVIESLGEVRVHGVAVRPGHPVIIGSVKAEIRNTKSKVPIIGVPGYPVSAAMTGEIFVKPLLAKWLGKAVELPETIEATLTRKLVSPLGDDDFVRMAVGRVGERVLAAPLTRGAGVISSLVRADGIVVVPTGSQGLAAGSSVQVRLMRPKQAVDQTILAIGSHDMTLDLLAQFLAQKGRRLSSANAGSLGGLIALKRGETHFAGSHLLDPETGEYNVSYIERYLPDVAVELLTLVEREQGLIVQKGNPLGLRDLQDVALQQARFVNRQRGAGTRVLLDWALERGGLSAENIPNYQQEEYTHLAVAAAIASGRADTGLGIAAAAAALDLDFIPLFQERYDLVIPKEFAHSDLLQPLFAVLENKAFKNEVARLRGYSTVKMGNRVAMNISPQ